METEFRIELISYTNTEGLRYDQRKKSLCCCDNERCEQTIDMNTCDLNISKCDIGLRVCVEICHFYICTSSGLIENNITSFNFSDGNNTGKLNNPMTYRFTERVSFMY